MVPENREKFKVGDTGLYRGEPCTVDERAAHIRNPYLFILTLTGQTSGRVYREVDERLVRPHTLGRNLKPAE